jgi:hypothetical protein
MAKKPQEVIGTDKGKIRLIYAEVEGNNQSLQDALKSMVAAMTRPFQVVNGVSRMPGNPAVTLAAQGEEDATEPELSGSPVEQESLPESDEAPAAPVRKRGVGPKVDRNAGIKLVPDIDFVPDGKPSLKTFYAEKAPKNDMENMLVILYYMQHVLDLSPIGPGHILTGLKDVGESVPVDIRGTIRNMKNQKVWVNYADLEAIRMATQGDNYVEHKLGAKENA